MTAARDPGCGPCALCGLAAARDGHLLRSGGHLLRFCCTGCRQAYVISRALRDAEFPVPGGENSRPDRG